MGMGGGLYKWRSLDKTFIPFHDATLAVPRISNRPDGNLNLNLGPAPGLGSKNNAPTLTPRSIDTQHYGRSFLLGRGARVVCRYVVRAAVRAHRDGNIDQTVFVYTPLAVGFTGSSSPAVGLSRSGTDVERSRRHRRRRRVCTCSTSAIVVRQTRIAITAP